MSKPNLILINGFAINKFLIKGFIAYLEQFFKVYVIDLPGHGDAETIKTIASDILIEFDPIGVLLF